MPFKFSRKIQSLAAFPILATIALTPASALPASSVKVTHVVIIWLKRPHNAGDQAALIHASREFRGMNGVLRVEAGPALPVTGPGLEQSFDLLVVFTFRDQRALREFEKDPRHLRAIHQVLQPLVKHYVVYNGLAE